ncbi:MAG: hypothetical protein L6247_05065 [Desulfobacteraceae bacterium]|nr:hypothetical protein [Desulfobacteraceae bacterium]
MRGKKIISKEVGLLVPPKDIEALTEAIDHMFNHYQEYSPDKIAQYARNRFSYQVVGQMLDDIYGEIVQKGEEQRCPSIKLATQVTK